LLFYAVAAALPGCLQATTLGDLTCASGQTLVFADGGWECGDATVPGAVGDGGVDFVPDGTYLELSAGVLGLVTAAVTGLVQDFVEATPLSLDPGTTVDGQVPLTAGVSCSSTASLQGFEGDGTPICRADPEVCYVQYIVGPGVDGGASASASWNTRALNTISGGPCTWVDLGGDAGVFTLEEGTYRVEARASSYGGGRSVLRLVDVVAGTAPVVGIPQIMNPNTADDAATGGMMFLEGNLSAAGGPASLRLEQWTQTGHSAGLGQPSDSGTTETYTSIRVTRVGG
jgi:hypothetical protein